MVKNSGLILLVGLALCLSASSALPTWYHPKITPANSSNFTTWYHGTTQYFEVKQLAGQGLCLRKTGLSEELSCHKTHMLGQKIKQRRGLLLFDTYNESFGEVNFNYLTDYRYVSAHNISVFKQEEYWTNTTEQNFQVSLFFSDFGQIRQDQKQLSSRAAFSQYFDYIGVDYSLIKSLQKYLNHRIYDFWNNNTRFELYQEDNQSYSPLTLRINRSCEGLSQKIPALKLKFLVQPADSYFEQDAEVLHQSSFLIHSVDLLQPLSDNQCQFTIAGIDTEAPQLPKILLGQPFLKSHNVFFVHDFPPVAVIMQKQGLPPYDDGDDFKAPVNPYERAEAKRKAHQRKKKLAKPELYDSFVDQLLDEYGLAHTIVGSIWREVERQNKVQIVLIVIGALLALLVSASFSFMWIAIVLEIVVYLYDTKAL